VPARAGDPRYRDYYVWAKARPPDAEKGVVFPGVQKTTWSFDRKAGQYYFHRFYDFQPDLNVANPVVRDEMEKVIGFWVNLGIAGYRVDAVPFLIKPTAEQRTPPTFEYCAFGSTSWREMRYCSARRMSSATIGDYFRVGGLHALLHRQPALWLALARGCASARRSAGSDGGIPERPVGELPAQP
jgi:maltose alpha-D-glucosyltransferase/alpha-amylase